jgi:hypothetical protein
MPPDSQDTRESKTCAEHPTKFTGWLSIFLINQDFTWRFLIEKIPKRGILAWAHAIFFTRGG